MQSSEQGPSTVQAVDRARDRIDIVGTILQVEIGYKPYNSVNKRPYD